MNVPSPTPIEDVCVVLHIFLKKMMVSVHMACVNIKSTVSVHFSALMFYFLLNYKGSKMNQAKCPAWVSVAVFVGKLSKIMTYISQYSLSTGRVAKISTDDAPSKMTHAVTTLNLRILSSDIFLSSDTDYHKWSSSSFSSLSPDICTTAHLQHLNQATKTSFHFPPNLLITHHFPSISKSGDAKICLILFLLMKVFLTLL